MLLGKALVKLNVLVAGLSDLVLSDGQVACNGVDHAGIKLHEGVVVVADGLSSAAGEGGCKLGLAFGILKNGKSSGVDLSHDGFAGKVGQRSDVAALLHHDNLLVEHVRLGEGVVALAAFHGEAVPNAVDVAGVEQGVLSVPVDGVGLEVPTVAVGDFLGKVKIEAGVVAVVADEAVRRISGVETDDEGFGCRRAGERASLSASRCAGGSLRAAAGKCKRSQGQRGCNSSQELELLHVVSFLPGGALRGDQPVLELLSIH